MECKFFEINNASAKKALHLKKREREKEMKFSKVNNLARVLDTVPTWEDPNNLNTVLISDFLG